MAEADRPPAPPPGKSADALLRDAGAWWDTSIIDIHPGSIGIRGYAIGELIGRVSYGEMVWLMLRGELPKREEATLLEAALVAGVDHGPHAPSIAIARMAITCGVGINGAMASAINVLDDVHGGAGQQCMGLYRAIEDAAHARELDAAVREVLDRRTREGERVVPGFGHRFHPVDPRVAPLLALVRRGVEERVVSGHYARIGQAVEAALSRAKGRNIPMNIDGVTAVIFCELGFAPELGRGLFVLSRSVGILAHAWEQRQQGRRIMGPMPKDIAYRYSGHAPRAFPGSAGQDSVERHDDERGGPDTAD